MPKKKIRYVCQECGAESVKWMGKCPACGNWNTLVEEDVAEEKNSHALTTAFEVPRRIADVDMEELPRFMTGSGELDRVLGGGLIPGSIILIAGDPGVGKSSLTLAVCANVARGCRKVLYITGEESSRQIRMRAERLNALADELYICAENNFERITRHVEKLQPEMLVVDSIQTIYRSEIESAPGSVSQVRECSAGLMRLSKSLGVTTFVIGHVTKDGSLAGPRVLEHIVDTVLFFEGERNADFRVLRAIKNRFGATSEIGLFEMRDTRSEEHTSELQSRLSIAICRRYWQRDCPDSRGNTPASRRGSSSRCPDTVHAAAQDFRRRRHQTNPTVACGFRKAIAFERWCVRCLRQDCGRN